MGTGFAAKQWRPVIRGHAVTGDIIAPIQALSYATKPISDRDVIAITEAGAAMRACESLWLAVAAIDVVATRIGLRRPGKLKAVIGLRRLA